jgi:hypothetical protein
MSFTKSSIWLLEILNFAGLTSDIPSYFGMENFMHHC